MNGNLDSDTLFGGKGDDFLRGGKNSDILTGGEGNDILIGDAGTDNLLGEAGADTFVLAVINNEEDNADTIEDFNFLSGDRIGVSEQISTLSFTQEGNNTVIQIETEEEENNIILGTVNDSIAEEVRNATFFFDFTTISVSDSLPFGDAALRIG